MGDMSIITVIGTVASIGAAWVSIKQALKAKDAAQEAKRIRSQLIDQRKTSELSILQASCKKAQNSMAKYGPASTSSSLAGINTEKDAFDVQDFIALTKEYRAYFGNKTPNKADEFCTALTPLLDSFVQSHSPDDLRKYGKQIVLHLSSIAAAIKKRLDRKREIIYYG